MARLSLILIFIASEKCVSMLSVPQQKGATAAAKGGCVGGEESVACTSQHTNSWENLAGWVAAAGDKKLVSR